MSINPLNDISKVYLEQVSVASRARNAVADDGLDAEQKKTNASMNRLRQQSNSNRVARADAAAAERRVRSDVKNSSAYGPQRPNPGTVTGRRIEKPKPTGSKPTGYRVEETEIDEAQKPNDGNLANNYPPYDKITRGDVIAGRLGKDEMGGKKKKKDKKLREGFSNWRQDLSEVIGDTEIGQQVKEKKNINNKVKTSAMGGGIKLGEAVEEIGGVLLEMTEIELAEEVNVATEYFYEQGLNEYGIDILIEDLGIDQFLDFVYEISEEYTLNEARTLTGKKKNPQKLPKGTSPTTLTKAAVKKYGTTRKLASSDSPTIKKNRVAVKKAVAKQPETKSTPAQTKTGIAGRVGAALGSLVKKGREDIKRVQDAAQTAKNVATRRGAEAKAVYDAVRERGRSAEQSATATRARRKAKVAAGRAVQAATPVVKKAVNAAAAGAGAGAGSLKSGKSPAAAAGRAAGTFVRKMTKEELELLEKAESEQQQKLFGLALSVKRGETSRSEVSDAVLKIVDTMSEKKIRDFAKTKHEGIPKKVEEDLQPTTPQQFAAQKQLAMSQKKLTAADQMALQRKKKESQMQQQSQEKIVSEEDYDTMKDRHLERGGMGARSSTSPAKSAQSKPVDPEKRKRIAQQALDLVRQQTISKYGKSSLM